MDRTGTCFKRCFFGHCCFQIASFFLEKVPPQHMTLDALDAMTHLAHTGKHADAAPPPPRAASAPVTPPRRTS